MIYNENEEYKIVFYKDILTGRIPFQEYLDQISEKDRVKVAKYIEVLRQHNGVLDEPYTKHIRGKLRELRVDFARNRHRIFYFTFINRNIVLLHAFLKNTPAIPESEIIKAENNLIKILNRK